MKSSISLCLLIISHPLAAQLPDAVYMPNIQTVQLYLNDNQLAYPVLSLNGGDKLNLDFDDLDANVKNYYYTYQLCNADWTPVQISNFDYIRGFAQNPIRDYHYSSIALTRYTHYHVVLPEQGSVITRSGNYLLKVFLDNDTAKLAFTKRMLVVDNAVSIAGQIFSAYESTDFPNKSENSIQCEQPGAFIGKSLSATESGIAAESPLG